MVRAAHHHLTGLDGLAQGIERLGCEFRQFIEEEHATMREAHLAGFACKPPPVSAAMLAE